MIYYIYDVEVYSNYFLFRWEEIDINNPNNKLNNGSFMVDEIIDQSKELIKFISEKSFDPLQGARYIRKNIQDFVSDPLAEKIILQSNSGAMVGSTITADVKGEEVTFQVEQAQIAVPA